MKKVSIIKNGQVAYACEGTQEQIDKWFAKHQKKFGQAAHTYERVVTEAQEAVYEDVEITPAVIAEDGTETSPAQYEQRLISEAIPAVYETVHVPADYEVVEEDLEQQKINAEAQAYLDSTDWYCARFVDSGTPIPEDIKQARAEARARIVR